MAFDLYEKPDSTYSLFLGLSVVFGGRRDSFGFSGISHLLKSLEGSGLLLLRHFSLDMRWDLDFKRSNELLQRRILFNSGSQVIVVGLIALLFSQGMSLIQDLTDNMFNNSCKEDSKQ